MAPAGTSAACFEDAARDLFRDLHWQIGVVAGAWVAVRHGVDGILAIVRDGVVELHLGTRLVVLADGNAILARLLPMAAQGFRDTASWRRSCASLDFRSAARFAGTPADDASLAWVETIPALQREVDVLLSVLNESAGRAAA